MEHKKYGQLDLTERIEIYRLHEDGKSCRFIAQLLERSPSTISRELRRNGRGGYDPQQAHKRYHRRHARGRRHKLDRHPALRARVLACLAMDLSPEQIAGRMALEHGKPIISHESIYRYIYWHSYHFRNPKLHKLLPRQRKYRRSNRKRAGMPPIPNRVHINKRPSGAINRSRYDHWEADLMHFSRAGRSVLALHDRKSRYTYLKWQETKKADDVIVNLHEVIKIIPHNRRKTTTFDNGQEFRLHTQLTAKYGIKTFFCDPHAPWQKGGVENINGRLRRFLPRKTDANALTNKETLKIL
jgi:IS30 family transposase